MHSWVLCTVQYTSIVTSMTCTELSLSNINFIKLSVAVFFVLTENTFSYFPLYEYFNMYTHAVGVAVNCYSSQGRCSPLALSHCHDCLVTVFTNFKHLGFALSEHRRVSVGMSWDGRTFAKHVCNVKSFWFWETMMDPYVYIKSKCDRTCLY